MRDLIVKNRISIIATIITLGLAAFIFFGLPRSREVTSAGLLLFKLTPFISATVAIAYLDRGVLDQVWFKYLAISGAFLFFFCVLVPKLIYYRNAEFEEYYYYMLLTVPYVILALVLTFRLGGGKTGHTIRLSIALLLMMLSGIEDLAFFMVNRDPAYANMPEVWDWVSHVTVFIGHPPTRNEIVVFMIVHFILAFLVLTLPFERVFNRFRRTDQKQSMSIDPTTS